MGNEDGDRRALSPVSQPRGPYAHRLSVRLGWRWVGVLWLGSRWLGVLTQRVFVLTQRVFAKTYQGQTDWMECNVSHPCNGMHAMACMVSCML